MGISIKINREAIMQELIGLGQEKQGPFILSRTLNLLAKEIQSAERIHVTDATKVKRPGWIKNQIRIDSGTWATKTRLKVKIYVTDQASFLVDLDEGNEHIPIGGRQFLAVPSTKAFGSKVIGKDNPLRIVNLHLKESPNGQLKGDLRTFTVGHNGKNKHPLILQRVSALKAKRSRGSIASMGAKTGLRLLYTLVAHTFRPKKLRWYDVANATVIHEQEGIWTSVMIDALRTARAKA